MRFIYISAPTLRELAERLNEMAIGSGRIVTCNMSAELCEAMIDMNPTHVITNDDIFMEYEEKQAKLKKLALSA